MGWTNNTNSPFYKRLKVGLSKELSCSYYIFWRLGCITGVLP